MAEVTFEARHPTQEKSSVTVALPDSVVEELDQAAANVGPNGISRSELIRQMIDHCLVAQGAAQPDLVVKGGPPKPSSSEVEQELTKSLE